MLVIPRKDFKRREVLSRNFVQASSRRLSIASGLPIIPLPITIGVWAFLTDNTVVSSLVYFNNTSDTTSQIGLDIAGTVANDPFRVWGGNSASSINNPPFNQWAHFAGVFSSTTSRTAYINGVAGTTDTGAGSTNALNTRLDVGALFRSDFTSGVNFMSGRIAVVAIWAAELTATEMRLLSAGADARRVRPETLRWLWELEGTGNELNGAPFYARNDGILVPANAPLPTVGPVIERLVPRRIKLFQASAGGGGQTVAITQVNETDTAQALTAVAGARTVAIGQVSSTETAQALTVAATRTMTIGQVASTETAHSLTAVKALTTAIAAAQESDAAQSITAASSGATAVTQVASTETAQPLTAASSRTVAVSQVQSTETAQALTVAATKTQAITQVASTETAQAFTAVQPGVFTAANEVDAAQALSVRAARTVALGQVSSVETAQSLTPRLTTTTGITLALEIDAAQALASIGNQSVAVTQAQETDTARALAVFFEGGALDTVALYSIVTQLVSLSSKQTRTRSGDSYIAPVVSRDSHIGD